MLSSRPINLSKPCTRAWGANNMKLTLGILLLTASAFAQPPRPAAPPKSPKDGAPVDLTGYWVSIVTEDWRWRMVTPLKGDSASVPVNAAASDVTPVSFVTSSPVARTCLLIGCARLRNLPHSLTCRAVSLSSPHRRSPRRTQPSYATGSQASAVTPHSPLLSTSQYLPVGWPRGAPVLFLTPERRRLRS